LSRWGQLSWGLGGAQPALAARQVRQPRGDDRTVISGILHVLKTAVDGATFRSSHGPPTTIYNRYHRWS
jgi:transposase